MAVNFSFGCISNKNKQFFVSNTGYSVNLYVALTVPASLANGHKNHLMAILKTFKSTLIGHLKSDSLLVINMTIAKGIMLKAQCSILW